MQPTGILSSALASTVLNAFQASPESGNVRFPCLTASNSGAGASIVEPARRLLVAETAGEFRTSVTSLLAQAGQVLEDGLGGLPFRIPETGGSWTIDEYAQFNEDSGFAHFTSLTGRFLFLAQLQESTEIFAGSKGRGVLLGLANAVGLQGEVSTAYHLAFFDQGVRSLRSYLKMEREPLYRVAIRMAEIIENSGQFSGAAREYRALYDLKARALYELSPTDDGLGLASPLVSADGRSLELTMGGEADQSGGVHIPDALAHDGREYFAIHLLDREAESRGELMSLNQALQNDLWEVATMMAGGWRLGSS